MGISCFGYGDDSTTHSASPGQADDPSASSGLGDAGDGDDDGQGDFSYPYCEVDDQRISQIIEAMTLRQKVAQMYIVGVQVTPWFIPEDTRFFIEDLEVGGVYVQAATGVGFWPEWSAKNMNALQTMAMSRENPVPLIITIDQEGGIAQAINNMTGGTDQPGNLGLWATFDPDDTYASLRAISWELAAVGVNADCAPVAGVMISHEETSMYTRCFGEITSEVSSHVKQAVRGLQENLVMATAKHFPSHSTAPGDEHFMLPVNYDSEQTVRDRYLPPFSAAIEADTAMIMTTHAVFSAWEDEMPSTFSRRIVTGLLREELGFDGLIVTDDMNMGSITLRPWDEHPDVLAFSAGVDAVIDCFGNGDSMFGIAEENLQYSFEVAGQIEAVTQAVLEGRLSRSRIDESVRRILRTKMKFCLFSDPFVDEVAAGQTVGTPKMAETSLRLHERVITLVRNDEGLFPLDPESDFHVHAVVPAFAQLEMYPDAAWGNIASTDLLREIRKIRPDASGGTFLAGPVPIPIDRLVEQAGNSGADVLVVGTYNALFYDQQTALVQGLLSLGIPTIAVATAMPYDLIAFPDVKTYLATYSNRDIALQAAARALFGLMDPKGRLPVSIPGYYDAGWSAGGD